MMARVNSSHAVGQRDANVLHHAFVLVIEAVPVEDEIANVAPRTAQAVLPGR
jgi:hypothetical protein